MVGVCTLGLACAFAAGWVRSLVACDQIAFALDATDRFMIVVTSNHFLTSKNGCIRWIRYEPFSNGVNPAILNPSLICTTVPLDSPSEPFDDSKDTLVHVSIRDERKIIMTRKEFIGEHYWHWRWQWWQFDFGKAQAYGDAPMFVWIVPYWSVTFPLTALAGWLISKPCKPTQLKTSPPIPKEDGEATS